MFLAEWVVNHKGVRHSTDMDPVVGRPPGRREINRQRRRTAILAVAYQCFAEHGYGGTTMSRIAAELGGSKATLWSYYASKEALFLELIDEATRAVSRELTAHLDPDDDPAEALRRFGQAFLTILTSPRALVVRRLVVGETTRFPELGRIFHERTVQPTRRLLADYVEELQRRRRFVEAPALPAAAHLVGLCLSGSYQLVLSGTLAAVSAEQIREDVAAAVRVFLAAYATLEMMTSIPSDSPWSDVPL
jgi:AcrR family transcriptional regulator